MSLNLHLKSVIILTVTANVSLSCETCGKPYTGETVDKFRSRLNNYITDTRKAASGNIKIVSFLVF